MAKREGYEAPAMTLVLVGQGVRATGADNSVGGANSDGTEPEGLWE